MKRKQENIEVDMLGEEEEEEEDNEDKGDDGNGQGQDRGLLSVDEIGVRHAAALLEVAGDVPLDVARTILAAHYRTMRAANASGRQRLAGGFIQCPTCSTPWIAGLCKSRLLGCPRNPKADHGRLRRILRRAQTKPGKLTTREKSLLSRYQNRENVIEVSCLVCRHKKYESFRVPEKRKKVEVEEVVEVSSGKAAKKRKKKRKVKEMNAGLLLSTTSSASKISKKGRNEREEASLTSPHFMTSLEGDSDTRHTQTDALDHPHRTFVRHKNTSTHPRFKKRPKVLLGNDTPGTVLPHPSTAATPGIERERKKTVANLKRIMSKEKAKSDLCTGGGKSKSSLSSFLDSLI